MTCTSFARAEALRCLEDFLAALPSELRMFLLSREDPGLGLHRLRLAGQLTELRDADLRFTPEEAEALLQGFERRPPA